MSERSESGLLKRFRNAAFDRQEGLCCWCGKDVPRSRATAEHVIPRARGGRTVQENIAMACEECNLARGTVHEYCRSEALAS
jgi:5-methylcytosine-specific restriction endonuclease McrA